MYVLRLSVGHSEIDTIHQELAELLDRLSNSDGPGFSALYNMLIEHTSEHFAHEESLMREHGFIHASEHINEHRQLLSEMRQFGNRPRSLMYAYVTERLPERFALHISRMDSLLTAYLRATQV